MRSFGSVSTVARRRIRAGLLPLLLLPALLAGCYTVRIDRRLAAMDPVHIREHFFAFGLIGEATHDLSTLCPKGVASYGDFFSPLDILFTAVTVGIYSPRTVTIECRM
jgi:hypothetical protein